MKMLENESLPIMKDWKDVPVHEGDTVIFVRITDGAQCRWDPYYESEVINYRGVLHMLIPGPEEGPKEILIPASLVCDMRHSSEVVFCIKGISDNEEAFYKEFYKPNMN